MQPAIVDEVVLVLIERAWPAVVDIVAAGRGESQDAVRALSGIDVTISLLQILDRAFSGRVFGDVGAELVRIIAEAATESSALASGNHSRH